MKVPANEKGVRRAWLEWGSNRSNDIWLPWGEASPQNGAHSSGARGPETDEESGGREPLLGFTFNFNVFLF